MAGETMDAPKKLGILIDISNVEESMADYNRLGMSLDYSEMIRQLSAGYDLKVLRGYDGISRNNPEKTPIQKALEAAGVELCLYQLQGEYKAFESKKSKQKEVDTSIVGDAVRYLLKNTVDALVIVSGDRDMHPAVRIAEEEGLQITVVAVKSAFSPQYADSLKDCEFLDDMEIFSLSGEYIEDAAHNKASFRVNEGGEINV